MSKALKDLISNEFKRRLDGVSDALLVSIEGLDSIANNKLRKDLLKKNIRIMVVKNSLARRATQGTALENAFKDLSGPAALVWGSDDIVSLAKEVAKVFKDPVFKK